MKASMRLYGKVPVKNIETGEYIFTNNRSNPNFMYVSLTEFVNGLAAQGKYVNPTNLEILKGTPTPAAAPPDNEINPPEEKPKKDKKPKKVKEDTWTIEELAELSWPDIKKLASKLDVHEKSRESITAAIIGKPKK